MTGRTGGEPRGLGRNAGARATERERQLWNEKEFRILSLDGGGVRGLFTAGVLAEWEMRTNEPIWKYFDYIAGTSTGGIIALGMGKGLRAREIQGTYAANGEKIFGQRGLWSRGWRWVQGWYRSRHNNVGLEETLGSVLEKTMFGESRRRLAIQATEGTYMQPWVYKTPHHPDFKKDWERTMVEVAMATSAAPTQFEAVSQGGYMMLDGGIAANDPVLVGVVDALSCYEIERRQVEVLSIGCQTRRANAHETLEKAGRIQWMRRAVEVANQILSIQSQGQAGLLIGKDHLIRINPSEENRAIEMDDWETAGKLLPDMAKRTADAEWDRVEEFFQETRPDPTWTVPKAREEQERRGRR